MGNSRATQRVVKHRVNEVIFLTDRCQSRGINRDLLRNEEKKRKKLRIPFGKI